jgi:phosphoadenosine phosphosulfate reductase
LQCLLFKHRVFHCSIVPLLHMISRICPNIPILFLDTGFHFDETIEYRDLLVEGLGLNVQSLSALGGRLDFQESHGELYKENPTMCCYLNKVDPLKRELTNYKAWITGIRKDQTKQRRSAKVAEQEDSGLFKLCPMLEWTALDVEKYINHFDLPKHPLYDKGYRSVGCAPCTSAVVSGQDAREGRWAGTNKFECGLHFGNK